MNRFAVMQDYLCVETSRASNEFGDEEGIGMPPPEVMSLEMQRGLRCLHLW